jgi:CPA2 family monovalent cation:H+ antiporter-2
MPIPSGLEEILRLFLPGAIDPELRFVLDIGVAVGLALVGGLVATRLGLPALVGYLLAGVVIGPFTPGFVGDQERIGALAELGIVLLLFTLGVQFSVREIREVGRVALVGASIQVVTTTLIAALAALLLGVAIAPAIVVGAALSISSTLVMVKVISARGEEQAVHARVAVGWTAVQDLLTVFLIVALPALVGAEPLLPLAAALLKAAIFLVLAYVVGTRLLPGLLLRVARLGSSELFLLTVIAVALIAALFSSAIFGLSLALGAFVAGVIVSESDIAHQAAAEVMPFRDLFAVLFFVSVGMLLDPTTLPASALLVLVLILVVVPGKWLVTTLLGRLMGLPARSAVLVGGSLAHAGEFTFVLGREALAVGAVAAAEYQALLGATAASIVLAPAAYGLAGRLAPILDSRLAAGGTVEPDRADPAEETSARRHVVVLGGGRIGWLVARAAAARGFGCVVVDRDRQRLDAFERIGAQTVFGDAANPWILRRVVHPTTRLVAICLPDPLTARLAAERIGALAPRVEIVARVAHPNDREILRRAGVHRFADEHAEAGIELARQSLQRLGVSSQELTVIAQGLRREAYGP